MDTYRRRDGAGLPLTVLALVCSCVFVGACVVSPAARAQLSNSSAPIVVSHYRLNVSGFDAHRRFWIDTLGGIERPIVGFEGLAIEFPDTLLLLTLHEPSGPTLGTTFDHIGFAVPDVPAMTERVVAAGFGLTVGREPAPGETAQPPTAGNYGRFSYLLGPDGVKVELVTNADADAPPIAHHHVHFVNREFVAMQQWYMRAFDATLRPGQTDFFIGADLPGVGYMLNFFSWLPAGDLVGTRGRVVDRVGFDVADLESRLATLAAEGIAVVEPPRPDPALANVTHATIVDPWGTVIELTEGLRGLIRQ